MPIIVLICQLLGMTLVLRKKMLSFRLNKYELVNFTQLKLWVGVARHTFNWVKII